MATSASRRNAAAARPAPRSSPEAAPRRANLKVAPSNRAARTDDRIWPAMTVVCSIAVGIAFVVAGLFAGDIQVQAEIDGIEREMIELRQTRIRALAERAWHDSPEGLSDKVGDAGLVPAAEVALLVPLAPGLLEPPRTADPFTPPGARQ